MLQMDAKDFHESAAGPISALRVAGSKENFA
jgi:hypothetical protein